MEVHEYFEALVDAVVVGLLRAGTPGGSAVVRGRNVTPDHQGAVGTSVGTTPNGTVGGRDHADPLGST